MTGASGICTFNWFCQNVAHGIHIGSCLDRFFVGSCCKIPQNSSFSAKSAIGSSYEATQTTKEDNKVGPLSEIINATIRPTSEQKVIKPIHVQNDYNNTIRSTSTLYGLDIRFLTIIPTRSTNSYMPTRTSANLSTKVSSSSSLSRKPVLPDIFLASSPTHTEQSTKNNIATNTQNYEISLSAILKTKSTTRLPLFKKSATLSTFTSSALDSFPGFTEAVSAENENTKFPLKESNDQRNLIVSQDSSFVYYPLDTGSQNYSWPFSNEKINDHQISIVLNNSTKRYPPAEQNKDYILTDNFFAWAYSILTNGDKNAPNTRKNESSAEENLISSTVSNIHPSQTSYSEMQNFQENESKIHDFKLNEIDVNFTRDSALGKPETPINIENVSLNFTKFIEPAYPWPSAKPSNPKNPDSSTPEAVIFRNISRVCGRSRNRMMARIVGGRKSHYLRWPWMISLRRFEGRSFEHKCGATLLNQLWAITAAHCVEGKMPNEFILRLGEYNLLRSDETHPHVERRIYLIIIHPGFDSTTYENDLALLRFYEPVQFRANIVPICLPKFMDDVAGRTAVVTGWGRLSEEGELPEFLHEVRMPILTNKECEEMFAMAGFSETIGDVFVCAGLMSGGLDACEGDSGGPMVVKGERGQWTLVGLISWGMGCAAPKQPGVYTRITKFVDWIDEIIGI